MATCVQTANTTTMHSPRLPSSILSKGIFPFGVAKVKIIDSGKEEGVWMEEINYTNINLYTIDVFNNHVKVEYN